MEERLRPRGIVVGLLLALAIGIGDVYNGMVRGSMMTLDFTTGAAVFLFFVVTLLNLLLRRSLPRAALNTPELLLAYIMMIIACTIPTMGIIFYVIPGITAPRYFANTQNRWAEIILPHIRKQLLLQDDSAVKCFFEGSPPGAAVPWLAWLTPLLTWAVFLFALYFVMLCIMVLVRKQWVEKERLIYPLTKLPFSMAEPAFFKNGVMWWAFAITFTLVLLNYLHTVFPMVPAPRLGWSVPMFRRTSTLIFSVNFALLGFSYLVSSEMSFSLWFFFLFQFVIRGMLNITGATPTVDMDIYSNDGGGPIFSYLQMGAILLLGVHILGKALVHDREEKTGGEREILPLPAARWGLYAGMLLMVLWLWWSGLPLLISIVFLLLALLTFLVITRVVCEAGLAEVRAPMLSSTWLISSLGPATIGNRGLVSFALTQIWHGDIRTFVMGSAGNAFKIAEQIREKRTVFWCIAATIVAVFASSAAMTIWLGYKIGALNGNGWFFVSGPQVPFQYAAQNIAHANPVYKLGWVLTAGGAVFTYLLLFMRYHFVWWPFHPLGFAFCGSSLTVWGWFAIFLGWLLKNSLLRLGGQKVYQRGIFFCLGLIAGTFVAQGVIFILGFFLKAK